MYLTKMCGIKNENPNKKKRFLPVTAKGQDSTNIKDRKKRIKLITKYTKNLEFLKMLSEI